MTEGIYLVGGQGKSRVEVYWAEGELYWSFFGESRAYKLSQCKLNNPVKIHEEK